MIEISHEILEQAVEREKADQQKLEKRMAFFMKFLFALCMLEILPLIVFIFRFGLKGAAWDLLIILADIIILFLGITCIPSAHFGIFSPIKMLNSFSDTKFYKEVKNSDTERQIQLWEERFESLKDDITRIFSAENLMSLYISMDMSEKADKLFESVTAFKPSNDLQRDSITTIMLSYYDYKNDSDSYVKLFENEKDFLIRRKWGSPRVLMKIGFLAQYVSYLEWKKDYAKAIEVYGYYGKLLHMAAETDNIIAEMLDSHQKYGSISYAKLYCQIGDKERAAEFFKEAMTKYDDSAEPSIKKFYAETKQLLDESGVNY
ncbi:MAG: hypothetical protein ACI4SF_06945 [Oscillospiraceae bacterium]